MDHRNAAHHKAAHIHLLQQRIRHIGFPAIDIHASQIIRKENDAIHRTHGPGAQTVAAIGHQRDLAAAANARQLPAALRILAFIAQRTKGAYLRV